MKLLVSQKEQKLKITSFLWIIAFDHVLTRNIFSDRKWRTVDILVGVLNDGSIIRNTKWTICIDYYHIIEI